jgi:hypothetical protein
MNVINNTNNLADTTNIVILPSTKQPCNNNNKIIINQFVFFVKI